MTPDDIFVKTAAGAEEVKSRGHKLPQRLRALLIMVDGAMTVRQLLRAAQGLGASERFLQELAELGLIVAVFEGVTPRQPELEQEVASVAAAPALDPAAENERFRLAHRFMNDTAVDALGLRAFFFTLKLEKCFNRKDLLDLLPEYTRVVTKGSGEEVARMLTARARDKLR